MKRTGILNRPLSDAIASMGHTDSLVICDAGLPIPRETRRIDLALRKGIPAFEDVLRSTLEELEVERAVLAEEIREKSPELHHAILSILDDIPVSYITHEQFKAETVDAKAIVRSGEARPFANIILYSGVVF
ncbi:D-ribose pyranase [Salinispira pacifica]|uniref:D-ribose pyranase n=1 Tax=Salinispira pacifica TaxID=1307761 RepID=V5WH75_9SPIO|nr:D-ribose pyranase [Salinispira pacifica]AHC14909.1 Ribose ABC transport system, high affinity permease RbsD [Salinispira pacifica]